MNQKIWSQIDLANLARHQNPDVRKWACERMKTLYGESGMEILETLLRDKEEKVVQEALSYLQKYPQAKFIAILLNLCANQQGTISGKSSYILGKLKTPGFIDIFRKKGLIKPIEDVELIWLTKALGELATQEAKEILRELLSKANEQTDPFFIQNLIHALLVAKEDDHVILNFYARFYPNFSMEILQPFAFLCGSPVTVEDLRAEEKKKFFKKNIPPVLNYTLAYLPKMGYSSLAKVVPKKLAEKNYSSLIELVWQQAEEAVHKKLKDGDNFFNLSDAPLQKSFQFLKSFRDYISWGPKESLKDMSIVALVILEKFIEFEPLIGLNLETLDQESIWPTLFKDRASLDTDDQLIEKLFAQVSAEIIFNKALEQLKKAPYSRGTERALRVLGRLREKRAVPILVDFLKQRPGDFALDECLNALVQIGRPILEYLANHFEHLNEQQKLELLFALRDIPEEETVDFLLRYWDDLWKIDKEVFLAALEGIGSRRFISPLRQELKEGETLEEDIFYLLCQIHGVDDPLLPQIEKSMKEREKEIEKNLTFLNSENLTALLRKPLQIELQCRQCGKPYFYEVKNVYLEEKDGRPIIEDKIVCKNCQAINQYELTSKANMAIIGQMILMHALADKGNLDLTESSIKIASTALMDGRQMSKEEMLKYYGKEIKRTPKDPALRIGYANVLIRAGREKEAVSQYEEALRLDPLAVEAYASLGELAADKGNFALAYDYFKKAFDCLHTGHYYRTKNLDQAKEAIVNNLEHYRHLADRKPEETYRPSSSAIVKQGKVGRNAPCPCGSGKKYKKCCLSKDELRDTPKTSMTPTEMKLRDELLSFSAKERYKKDFKKAYELFFRKPFQEVLVIDEKEEADFPLFLDWFIHDYILGNGATIAEEFYQEKRRKISEEQIILFKNEIPSYLSFYEITSVSPGKGLTLKDLITGEELEVWEVSGSLAAVKWDVLLTRVIKMSQVNKLSGAALLLPRRTKEEILSVVKNLWEKFQKQTGQREWSYFMKTNAYFVYHLMKDQPIKEPIFVTEEHHQICSATAFFEVKDFEGVSYRLSKTYDFVIEEEKEDQITFTWLKRGESKDWEVGESIENSIILKSEMVKGEGLLRWTSLGTITLRPKSLQLWCVSKERLERGKKRLKEVLGDYIQHKKDTFEDVGKMIKGSSKKPPADEKKEFKEKAFPILRKTMEEFALRWLDEPIPALGGKTPREAVQTPEGKRKVEELLKDFENMEERKRKDGEVYIDVNELRKMLGL
ncbi:MAG: SEC-C metal-binding domain-containing protein [Thermodesulfobacteriota bacterium]